MELNRFYSGRIRIRFFGSSFLSRVGSGYDQSSTGSATLLATFIPIFFTRWEENDLYFLKRNLHFSSQEFLKEIYTIKGEEDVTGNVYISISLNRAKLDRLDR